MVCKTVFCSKSTCSVEHVYLAEKNLWELRIQMRTITMQRNPKNSLLRPTAQIRLLFRSARSLQACSMRSKKNRKIGSSILATLTLNVTLTGKP